MPYFALIICLIIPMIQKVIASRKELVEYERKQREAALASALPVSAPPTPAVDGGGLEGGAPEQLFPTVAPTGRAREVEGCDVARKKEK